MLRGLARWLRFLGYSAQIVMNPAEAKEALQNHRNAVFLTGSRKHFEQLEKFTVLLLKSERIPDQLQKINEFTSLFDRIDLLSLCSLCNTSIEPVKKESLREKVPARVWQTQEQFWMCPSCGKIYWEGGHVRRLKDKLKRMNIPI
ncbi:MAG: Mut7-C RNAse domain-containing protein [Calditrichia bacterium]